jgi:alkylation response protein AidB-like acyl-CoA dehydrogenase/flavin-dependent dehydrogenase/electron transfer flavoprotein alpha subunit/ferredoxin-like protein FixX
MALQSEVVIVGAGPAGITAAAALARAGVPVLVLEGGRHPGAENWSGAVYFCENLVAADAFGPEILRHAPVERPVYRRGLLATDGIGLIGLAPEGAEVYRHCYTVQRPLFDRFLADAAEDLGATVLSGCHATALIRDSGRVVGVMTDQGPVYADVVFVAEGDASQLVTREGYEEVERPHFAQGVKAVLNLSAEEIERRFHLAPNQGAAYEILIRNPIVGGRPSRLNAGGFLYTNRDTLALGYVLPLDAVHEHWRGDHHRLLEWLRGLPSLAPYLAETELVGFGTKLIRIGGTREMPRLVDHGLAIGGAATGIGVDFPCPNFTGPATFMGLAFARAVIAARASGVELGEVVLAERYAEPVRASSYYRDAHWLRRWPGYVESTPVFFSTPIDWTLRAGTLLADRSLGWATRIWGLGRVFEELVQPRRAGQVMKGLWRPVTALGLGRAALRGLTLRHPVRWLTNLLPAGRDDVACQLVWRPAEVDGPPPAGNVRGGRRLRAAAEALALLYANDQHPLDKKLPAAVSRLLSGLSLLDLVLIPLAVVGAFLLAVLRLASDGIRYKLRHVDLATLWGDPASRLKQAREAALTVDPAAVPETTPWSDKTATIAQDATTPHMRVFWPPLADGEGAEAFVTAPLWRVCPVQVYEVVPQWVGQPQVTVNFENCLKCESCWRATPLVDWSRTRHASTYPVHGEVARLWARQRAERPARPSRVPRPHTPDPPAWIRRLGEGLTPPVRDALTSVLAAGEAFQAQLEATPRVVDAPALAHLRRHLDRIANGWQEVGHALKGVNTGDWLRQGDDWLELAHRHLADHKLFWATADIDCLCGHHVAVALTGLPTRRRRAPVLLPAFPPAGDTAEPVGALRAALSIARRKALEEGEEGVAEWVATQDLDRVDPLDLVHTVAAAEPGLAWCLVSHHLALALWGDRPQPWPTDTWLTVPGENDLEVVQHGNQRRLRGTVRGVSTALATWMVVQVDGCFAALPLAEADESRPLDAVGLRSAHLTEVRFLETPIPPERLAPRRTPAVRHAARRCAQLTCAFAAGFGGYLTERAAEYAAGRIQFGDTFRDRAGRTGIDKFGAVKAMLADCHARLAGLTALARQLAGQGESDPGHAMAYAIDCLSPNSGSFAYNAGQVFGGTAYSEDDFLAKYYRDAAVLRFLWEAVRVPAVRKSAPLPPELDDPAFTAARSRWDRLRTQLEPFLPEAPGDSAHLLRGYAGATLALFDDWQGHLAEGLTTNHAEVMAWHLRCTEAALGALRKEGVANSTTADLLRPPFIQVEPGPTFGDFLGSAGHYTSSDFLVRPGDPDLPCLTPEAVWRDPDRAARWDVIRHDLQEGYLPRHEGDYARTLDTTHHLPDGDVAWIAEHNWYATIVPEAEGGLGWKKTDYALLNWQVMTEIDPSVCLLIMANTSIGTTPVLLGLDQEIPQAERELSRAADDPTLLSEIEQRLDRLIADLAHPEPAKLTRDTTALVALVDERLRHTRVLKYLAGDFLMAFYGGAQAGRRRDLAGFSAGLQAARGHLAALPGRITTSLEEIALQKVAHRRYLQGLACGRVAAFALTEPTAGSDSGGVATHAMEVEYEVQADARGVLYFEVDGERRNLADADRLRFDAGVIHYDYADGKSAELRLTAPADVGPARPRVYDHDGQAVELFDVAAVRRRGDGSRYVAFYELTGAKMWITNGRVAHQFALYAKTAQGVSGFMVDRFAEGLVVGLDETKLGQRASPTNELSLNRVRVPRENLIGFAGHGQVNALETLNAGRMGLAVASAAMTAHLTRWLQGWLADRPARCGRHTDRLLERMASEAVAAESVAFFTMGLFDHPGVTSARMESAVAKYFCSEALHRAIDYCERALAVDSASRRFPVEKMRRDARVLNIYEGTNEVQRFLAIKELVALMKEGKLHASLPSPLAGGAWPLWSHDRFLLVDTLQRAVARLDDALWNDGDLQPMAFSLVEMAANLLVRFTVLKRLDALRAVGAGEALFAQLLDKVERGHQHAFVRFQQRFESDWDSLQEHGAPLATALFEATTRSAGLPARRFAAPGKLHVMVVADRALRLSPRPHVDEAGTWEVDRTLQRENLDVLAQVAEWQRDGVRVTVTAVTVGDEAAVRDAIAAGADRGLLISGPTTPVDRDWATLVAGPIAAMENPPDLVIVADRADHTGAPHRAEALAAALSAAGVTSRPWRYLTAVDRGGPELENGAMVWHWQRSGGTTTVTADGPWIAGWSGLNRRLRTDLARRGRGWRSRVAVVTGPEASPLPLHHQLPLVAATHGAGTVDTAEAAAALVLRHAGDWGQGASGDTAPLRTPPSDAVPPGFADLPWLIAAESGAAPLATTAIADLAAAGHARFDTQAAALYLTDLEGDTLARRLTAWQQAGVAQVVVVQAPRGPWPAPQVARWLQPILDPAHTVGGRWLFEASLGAAATLLGTTATGGYFVGDRTVEGALVRPAYQGRLAVLCSPETPPSIIALAGNGETPAPVPELRWWHNRMPPGGQVEPWWQHLTPRRVDLSALTEAPVIIDVGYGIGNAEGIEAVVPHLKEALEGAGLGPVAIGATRKVTQDLKLLPVDRQIGQTGVSVKPRLLIALGVSGAPQHMDWIARDATIIAFNNDPGAPIMSWNESHASPRVYAVAGDLFKTIPAFCETLIQQGVTQENNFLAASSG